MAKRPFRFGVVFSAPYTAADVAEFARRLEGEGFDTLLAADHHPQSNVLWPDARDRGECHHNPACGQLRLQQRFPPPGAPSQGSRHHRHPRPDDWNLASAATTRRNTTSSACLRRTRRPRATLRGGDRHHHAATQRRDRRFRGPTLPSVVIPRRPEATPTAGAAPDCRRWPADAPPRRTHGEHRGNRPAIAARWWRRATGFTPTTLDSKVELLKSAVAAARPDRQRTKRNILIYGVPSSVDAICTMNGAPVHATRVAWNLAVRPTGRRRCHSRGVARAAARWGLTYFVCWADRIDKLIPVDTFSRISVTNR